LNFVADLSRNWHFLPPSSVCPEPSGSRRTAVRGIKKLLRSNFITGPSALAQIT
jgi:hypothetical protein